MALDEATTALLAQLAGSGARPLHEMTPDEARGFTAAMRGETGAGPEMASVRDTRIRVSGGHAALRILTPGPDPRGVIVYYHGGGWVLGGPDDSDLLGRRLAQRTGSVVILVDYRLAPEYRFPTAVDDSWAALQWTAAHLAELAGPAAPLIVAGDSAGGNLAAVMTQRARAAGGPPIAAQVLAYPVTDCDLRTTSYLDPANELLLTRDSMIWFWDHYLPDQCAANFAGLPPAVIATAEHDVLRDEGELYATRLVKARVPVRHRRFAGQMHGFFTMAGVLPGADAGLDFVVAGLEPYLARSSPLDGARAG
jgi:acetyl esterase